MEDPPEAGNLPCGRRHETGIGRAVDAVGTSYRWWILAVAASTLDSTLTAGSEIMDATKALGTSNRRAVDDAGNVTDVM
jgi:hypothetical protein